MTTYTSEPGTRLGDRYRLEDRIAAGSGWAAWKAIDETLARAVTVFTFAPGFPRVADVVTAARTASRLTDPRLAQVFDVEDDWERAYIVMEWAAGETLGDLLSQGPLEPSRAGRMIAEVAAALSAAHAAGVAHMCLSPGSVRWSQTGEVKVVGLGIDAALSGTIADDPALADTVGLGRLLYAALTGYWPGLDYPSLPPAPVSDGLPRSPRQVVAGVPLELSDLTCKAMQTWSRDSNRLATPDELARALLVALPPVPPPLPDLPAWRPDSAQRGRNAAQGEYWHPDDGYDGASWRHPPSEQYDPSGGSSAWADTAGGPGESSPRAGTAGAFEGPSPRSGTAGRRQRAGRHGSRQSGWQGRSAADEGLPADQGDWNDGLARRGGRRAAATGSLPRLRQALNATPIRKPIAVVAAVSAVAVVAVTAFALLPGGGRAPSGGPAGGKSRTPTADVTSLPISDAAGFDPLTSPQNDTGDENSQQAPYAIDNSPRTAWTSQYYKTATFGSLKAGSGLILDMGKAVTITSVTVTFGTLPGADVSLLIGNSNALSRANLDSMARVASAVSPTGAYTFSIHSPRTGRFLVIWFTRLPPKPDSSGWYMAEVFNVAVKGIA